LTANAEKAKALVARLARDFPREHEPCPIGSDRALDTALITAPEARDKKLLKKLDAVAGRGLKPKKKKKSGFRGIFRVFEHTLVPAKAGTQNPKEACGYGFPLTRE